MPTEGPLVDRFGRVHSYLRVSVTDRCDFRCVYCMPAAGLPWQPHDKILSYEEIARLVRILAACGVHKVRLTGGEPTVRRKFESLVRMIREIPEVTSLPITTNGARLSQLAPGLKEAGVTALNVSLDTLRPDRFLAITRRNELDNVLSGLDKAMEVGIPLKVNVVVLRGTNDDEIVDFVDFAADRPMQVRFIEFMPFPGNEWDASVLVPFAEMKERIESKHHLIPLDRVPSAVGLDFAIEGHQGQVAFVASMTRQFCGDCDRLRLTADGHIKNCLFSTSETPLRDAMRAGATDKELEMIVREALWGKWAGHPGYDLLRQSPNRPMTSIGG